jgi:hypothetical protein
MTEILNEMWARLVALLLSFRLGGFLGFRQLLVTLKRFLFLLGILDAIDCLPFDEESKGMMDEDARFDEFEESWILMKLGLLEY